jgi:hypothetical protein
LEFQKLLNAVNDGLAQSDWPDLGCFGDWLPIDCACNLCVHVVTGAALCQSSGQCLVGCHKGCWLKQQFIAGIDQAKAALITPDNNQRIISEQLLPQWK